MFCQGRGSRSRSLIVTVGEAGLWTSGRNYLFSQSRLVLRLSFLLSLPRTLPQMMGLNCGEIAPGRDADLAIIDLTRPNLIPTTRTNVMENLIWASDGSEGRATITPLLHHRHRLLRLPQDGAPHAWFSGDP